MTTKPTLVFCFLAFAISWVIFFAAIAVGAFDQLIAGKLAAFAFMWGPALSAIICAWILSSCFLRAQKHE